MRRWLPLPGRRSTWRTYVGAVVMTGAVIWGRLALDASWGHQRNRHLVFFPTVMLSAWFGGFRAGLLSTALSTLAISYFWTGPQRGVWAVNPELALFFVIGIAICLLVGSLQDARARAEAAQRSLEQILAVVAHDLRNPLSAIDLTTTQIRKSFTDARLQSRLAVVDRAVLRMSRLVSDLLDVSRIEHGGPTMQLREENVNTIAAEALELHRLAAEASGVTLDVKVAAAENIAKCDRQRLLQVLGNLIDNALKFTPAGGKIVVE